jgi:membrane protease subunit (stomatin/prohibitin family)
MGFIKAFAGALGGTFADQWKDFIVPRSNVPATAGVFGAELKGTDNGRGSNTKGSENIITNGSKIVIPEGTALITMQDGAITGCVTDPGGYIYSSDDQNSKSFLSGGGFLSSTLITSWERFKFGGTPGAEQIVFYVNLKEIPGNRFGTQSEIYWDDAYMNAQVGAITRGTYTLKITDPILFIKNFVPIEYLRPDSDVFDFADMDNPAGEQLFNEVVASLSAAFSNYTNDPSKGNRITKIQGDQIGFAASLSAAVEEGYQWKSGRGLEIMKVALAAIEYDEDSKKLLSDVKKADALSGARGNSFMQQSVARGFQAAGENSGGSGMAFMGMGVNAVGTTMGAFQQPVQQQSAPQQEDPYEKLAKLKKLLDAGAISQEEYDAVKAKVLEA